MHQRKIFQDKDQGDLKLLPPKTTGEGSSRVAPAEKPAIPTTDIIIRDLAENQARAPTGTPTPARKGKAPISKTTTWSPVSDTNEPHLHPYPL